MMYRVAFALTDSKLWYSLCLFKQVDMMIGTEIFNRI